jgi:hypothetical protein
MDIRVPAFEVSKSLNLDISITDPRFLYGAKKIPIPGLAARNREEQKIRKYVKELDPDVTVFHPFVLEVFGRWGTRTRAIFSQIVRKWCAREGLSESEVSHRWKVNITAQMMVVGIREVLHKRDLALREYSGDNAGLDFGGVNDGDEVELLEKRLIGLYQ